MSRKTLFMGLALAAMTIAVFYPITGHDFVNYDDPQIIFKNQHVLPGLTLEGIRWAVTSTHASNWIPLAWISHMVGVELFGVEPMGHHFMSLIVHVAAVLMLFAVLNGMTGAPWRSFFATALFAVHPLRVESVAWASELRDVLSGFFWFLTLGVYFRYTLKPVWWRYVLVFVTLALGLMVKPMLVTLPFALLLLDFWPLGRMAVLFPPVGTVEGDPRAGRRPWYLLREKLPLMALVAVFSTVTYLTQLAGGAIRSPFLEAFPLPVRLANALVAYVKYLGKAVWPSNLAVFYPHPGASLPWWQPVAALLLLLALSIWVIRERVRRPYLAVGWFWYLGTMVPVIGAAQAGSQAMADRYTYIPVVGICLLTVWGIADLFPRRRRVIALAASLALAALMTASRAQVGHWKDSLSLFEHTLSVTGGSDVAHNNYGNALLAEGRYQDAAHHYEKALELSPYNPKALYNYGLSLVRTGRPAEAIPFFQKSVEIDPDDADVHLNLGIFYSEIGRPDESEKHYLEALRLRPGLVRAHRNLGELLQQRGRHEEAADHLGQAVLYDSGDAKLLRTLGDTLFKAGRVAEAAARYRQALQAAPGDTASLHNLGNALFQLGETAEATAIFSRVLEVNPDSVVTRYNLGMILSQEGRPEEAESQYLEAVRIDPDFAPAFYQLGRMYREQGKIEKSREFLERAEGVSPNVVGGGD